LPNKTEDALTENDLLRVPAPDKRSELFLKRLAISRSLSARGIGQNARHNPDRTASLIDANERLLCADSVAKVENRTTLKISRKSMFRRFYRCNAC
jgi:hypothetical protein